MDLTTQRRVLTTMAAGFLAVAVGAVVWSLGGIDGVAQDASAAIGRRDAAERSGGNPAIDTRTDQTAPTDFSLPLQKSLFDRPKPPPPPPKPRPKPIVARKPTPAKKPALDWTLTGTIIDANRSVAILTDASGKTDIRGMGEEVDLAPAGVLIRKIDSDRVTLDVRGTESTLRLKQSFSPGGGGNGGGNSDRPGRRRNR